MRLFLGVTALCLALAPLCVAVALPIVDLGYELHQANPINVCTFFCPNISMMS